MRIRVLQITWLSIASFVFGAMCIGFACSAGAIEAAPSAAKNVSLKQFLQTLDDSKTARFIAAFSDLDGDGADEAIVYMMGGAWCGSGGCDTLILRQKGQVWEIVTEITVTRFPIRVLPTMSNGWHDIGVWVQGGGIRKGYEAELNFDGKTYPRNPTVTPAHQGAGSTGKVLIDAASHSEAVY